MERTNKVRGKLVGSGVQGKDQPIQYLTCTALSHWQPDPTTLRCVEMCNEVTQHDDYIASYKVLERTQLIIKGNKSIHHESCKKVLPRSSFFSESVYTDLLVAGFFFRGIRGADLLKKN